MNDGQVQTSGGCVTWPEGPPATIEEATGPNPKPMGDPHAHPTQEAAERCFYAYELNRLREHQGPDDDQHRCEWISTIDGERCPNWTSRWLDGWLLTAMSWLCDEHRTASHWGMLHPFEPSIQIAASW